MAILAAASSPSTSAVGSASAKPSSCASAKRLFVAQAVLLHPGEHVVGGAVHDAGHRADLVAGERVLQRTDDRDAAAHARLEEDVDAGFLRGVHDLLAVRRDERLVRRDHALAVPERGEHDVAGDPRAADELDDNVDLGVARHAHPVRREVRERQAEFVGARLGEVGEPSELDVDSGTAAEVELMTSEDLDDARADGAEADQTDANTGHVNNLQECEQRRCDQRRCLL